MTDLIQPMPVSCPYCGETFEALVDISEGSTEYVQDCEVCCNPIRLAVNIEPDGTASLEAAREDD